MISWLNGPFGAGKTTKAKELVTVMPGTRLLGVEWVGYLLAENPSDHELSDVQKLPPWRALVRVLTNEGRGGQLTVTFMSMPLSLWLSTEHQNS